MELLAYYIYGTICLVGGLALGYYWRSWEDKHCKQRVSEPMRYSIHDEVDTILEAMQ